VKKWAVLGLLSAAMFIIVIDTTIMNVSISALVEDLNTTVGGVQAAISIYALVMASFILIGGKLADIVGKKRTFITGLIIFGVGTTMASFSQTLGMLIIGWSILEGLGSALMMPNIQTLLRDEYEGKDRAFSYGIIGAVAAVGAAVGPIVGGFLTTFASWRWAFRLEVLIVILVLVFSGYIKKDVLPDRRPRFDFLGALLNVVGWAFIVLGILLGGTYGFWLAKQPFVIGDLEIAPFGLSIVPFMIGFGTLVIMLLFRWERRLEEKGGDGLFRPSLFRIKGLPSGFAVRFTQMAITAAFLFIFPLMLQLSFEFTAMETGIALVPFSLALLITAIVGARLSARFKAKRIIQVGFVIAIAGLITMQATIQPEASPTDLASGALFGAGLGLIASQILNLILSSVKPGDTAETAGLNGTFEQLGNAIGVALVGTIMLVTLSAGLQAGIESSTVIPEDDKAPLSAAVKESVELVSNSQLEVGLEAAAADESVKAEVIDIYGLSRTQAFKAGIAFLIFLALGGLILTGGLSDRKLVGEESEEDIGEEAV
jgi:MFS family permease